jgi:DNA-binding response OmpR family regulator
VATILIVEEDGLTARSLVRTLREAGYTTILARDGRSALQEAAAGPNLVVLDLRLPDQPGEALLQELKRQPETSGIPVLVVSGEAGAAALLAKGLQGQAAAILLKPVSRIELLQAVEAALAHAEARDAKALWVARKRQEELIWRLIIEGPDPFVMHLCRRLSADRPRNAVRLPAADTLSWSDIAEWARREGLLDAEQARLLSLVPLPKREAAGKGMA